MLRKFREKMQYYCSQMHDIHVDIHGQRLLQCIKRDNNDVHNVIKWEKPPEQASG